MRGDNKELVSEGDCFMSNCQNTVYRWWPYTEEGLRHEGQSMLACEQHFHELWAPEGDGEEE